MASAAIATTVANDDAPQVAGEIIVLDPREIVIGDRLRAIDPAWAAALGKTMQSDGQIHPINVCRVDGVWHLAGPGGHRLTGAKMVGLPIEAREVSTNIDGQRRREAVENVFRRQNDPIERAAALAELVRLHKLRHGIDPSKDGRAASVNARWQKRIADEADDTTATIAVVYGWTDDVAADVGLSARTVRDDLMLYRRLPPSLIDRLRRHKHPALKNAAQLRSLAKIEADQQAKVVELLVAPGASLGHPQPKTVNEAIGLERHFAGQAKPKPDAEAKRLSAFLGAYQRMSLAEKKGALTLLRDMLPAGFRLGGEA